jgi:tetratricopeptide (TPR) repeat protein
MSNPLSNPKVYERLSILMVRDMTRLALSIEQLTELMRKANKWQKGSTSTLQRYLSGNGEHKITSQTLGYIAKALEWTDEERNWVQFGDDAPGPGIPTRQEMQDQWSELHEYLRRSSNLPYEIQQNQARASRAVDEEDYEKAQIALSEVSALLCRPAVYAAEEYGRALAAEGALAFTFFDYPAARTHYGKALEISLLPATMLADYQNSYRIAINACIAQEKDKETAWRFLEEMQSHKTAVQPNVVTFSTLMHKAATFAEASSVIEKMEEVTPEPVQPNVVTFGTLMNKAATFAEASSVIEKMEKVKPEPVQPNVVTFGTLMNKAATFAEAYSVIEKMEKVKPEPVQPDVVSFTTLMKKAATFAEAYSVIEKMEKVKPEPVQPDVVTFSTLMKKATTFEEAVSAIAAWKPWGKQANQVFESLTLSLSRKMDAEETLGVCFSAATAQGIKFPTTSLQRAISEYIVHGALENAFRIAVAFPHLPGALKAMKAFPNEAEAFFKKHLCKEPHHSSYALARLFDATGNADECVVWCKEALTQNGELPIRVNYIQDIMERNQPNKSK